MNETPLLCWKHWPMRLQLAARDMCNFDPNIWIFWAKSIFCFGIAIFCLECISLLYLGLQLSHWHHPEKTSVSEVWVVFRGSPQFLAILGQSPIASISNLNFGPWSMQLGGTVQATKKWPTMTTDLVPAGIAEKRPFLRYAEKRFFGQKSVFPPKNTRTLL